MKTQNKMLEEAIRQTLREEGKYEANDKNPDSFLKFLDEAGDAVWSAANYAIGTKSLPLKEFDKITNEYNTLLNAMKRLTDAMKKIKLKNDDQ